MLFKSRDKQGQTITVSDRAVDASEIITVLQETGLALASLRSVAKDPRLVSDMAARGYRLWVDTSDVPLASLDLWNKLDREKDTFVETTGPERATALSPALFYRQYGKVPHAGTPFCIHASYQEELRGRHSLVIVAEYGVTGTAFVAMSDSGKATMRHVAASDEFIEIEEPSGSKKKLRVPKGSTVRILRRD